MRKQYYFRKTENGFDAWDVDRLIELSSALSVKDVTVASIEDVDTAYWFGTDGSPMTVRVIVRHMQLVNAVDPSYPIILAADGRVMDGMHRIARALLEGKTTVSAVQFEVQPDPDFRNVHPDDLPY